MALVPSPHPKGLLNLSIAWERNYFFGICISQERDLFHIFGIILRLPCIYISPPMCHVDITCITVAFSCPTHTPQPLRIAYSVNCSFFFFSLFLIISLVFSKTEWEIKKIILSLRPTDLRDGKYIAVTSFRRHFLGIPLNSSKTFFICFW